MTQSARIMWATHPRHLPKPPGGRVVVVDVAFAAGNQFETRTRPFIEALGDRLVRWIDHHIHREAWPEFANDERFVLVPNKIAHACPELVTPSLVAEAEGGRPVDMVVAHADFDGLVAGVKWRLGGESPWPEADEDARAVDSPGRGHSLSERGARLAYAIDEASAALSMKKRLAFLSEVAQSLLAGHEEPAFEGTVDEMAGSARVKEREARELAETAGYFSLNPLGVLIWQLLEQPAGLDTIVEGVRLAVDDAPPSLRTDVEQFLDELLARELLTRDTATS